MALLKALLLLCGMAAMAIAQVYTPWYVPYYADCSTRTIANLLCTDGIGIWMGQATPYQINSRSIFFTFGGSDSSNATEFLRASDGDALSAAVSSAANSSSARPFAPQAGILRNLYCSQSAAAHGGATFTYRIRINDVDSALNCVITDATTSCSDTTNLVSVGQFVAFTLSKVDSAGVTDGTQVQRCSVELVY